MLYLGHTVPKYSEKLLTPRVLQSRTQNGTCLGNSSWTNSVRRRGTHIVFAKEVAANICKVKAEMEKQFHAAETKATAIVDTFHSEEFDVELVSFGAPT